MEYLFLLNSDESRWATMPPDVAEREYGAYYAYTEALKAAGIYLGGNPLEPTSTATCVTIGADGKSVVHDGPYSETKEQLGGYYLVDVPNLDTALSWAARCPTASHGTVEVRPVMQIPART